MPAVGFMLGLDRLALLLERQQALPAAEPVAADRIDGDVLGAALASARAKRASGRRVRFDAGAKEGR
jgi:histidyl-tRNA synthetase